MAKKGKVVSYKKAKTASNASASATKATNSKKPDDASLPENLLLPASKFSKKPFVTEELHPGCIWVVHDFLEPRECQAWIDFVEASNQLEVCGHPATKYIAHRECFRWQRNNDQIAHRLFERMKHTGVLKELQTKVDFSSPTYLPTAANPNIRFYKYDKGMSFGKHIDGSHRVDGIGNTEVTVLVYLSECQGGATRFYSSSSSKKNKPIAFSPKIGALLVHVHGDRCLEHEADPVESGTKYILRTDIVYSD